MENSVYLLVKKTLLNIVSKYRYQLAIVCIGFLIAGIIFGSTFVMAKILSAPITKTMVIPTAQNYFDVTTRDTIDLKQSSFNPQEAPCFVERWDEDGTIKENPNGAIALVYFDISNYIIKDNTSTSPYTLQDTGYEYELVELAGYPAYQQQLLNGQIVNAMDALTAIRYDNKFHIFVGTDKGKDKNGNIPSFPTIRANDNTVDKLTLDSNELKKKESKLLTILFDTSKDDSIDRYFRLKVTTTYPYYQVYYLYVHTYDGELLAKFGRYPQWTATQVNTENPSNDPFGNHVIQFRMTSADSFSTFYTNDIKLKITWSDVLKIDTSNPLFIPVEQAKHPGYVGDGVNPTYLTGLEEGGFVDGEFVKNIGLAGNEDSVIFGGVSSYFFMRLNPLTDIIISFYSDKVFNLNEVPIEVHGFIRKTIPVGVFDIFGDLVGVELSQVYFSEYRTFPFEMPFIPNFDWTVR